MGYMIGSLVLGPGAVFGFIVVRLVTTSIVATKFEDIFKK